MRTRFDRDKARKRQAEIVRAMLEKSGEECVEAVEALRRFEAGEQVMAPYPGRGCSSYTPDELRDHMDSIGAGTPRHPPLVRASSTVEPMEPDMALRRRIAPRRYRRIADLMRDRLADWRGVAASGEAFALLVTGGDEVQRGAAALLLLDALASKLGSEDDTSFEDYHELEGSCRASTLYGGSNEWSLLEPAKNARVLALHGIEAAVRGSAQLHPLCEILRYRASRLKPLVLTSAIPAQQLKASLQKPNLAPEGTDVLRYLDESTKSASNPSKEMVVNLDEICPGPPSEG